MTLTVTSMGSDIMLPFGSCPSISAWLFARRSASVLLVRSTFQPPRTRVQSDWKAKYALLFFPSPVSPIISAREGGGLHF